MANWKKYALWFAQEHVDFRYAELQSIAKALKIPMRIPASSNLKLPYCLIELPGDNYAKQLASRSILLRCILELWSHSNHIPTLHSGVQAYIKDNPSYVTDLFTKSFRITVDTYNKHFTQKEKVDKIETFSYLPLRGEVDLRSPTVNWWYIEYYGLDPLNIPEQPDTVIFGRWVADGKRSLIKDISLKTRKFIGNTSMDPQLSLLMANQALAKKGDLVLDPFVGTGSLLVAAAKFGAYVLGSDIDYLMLHARTRPSRITQKVREKDESIRANLKQYNCDHLYLDILVSDFSKSVWNQHLQFNSIITDPPYGIRESVEKIEPKQHTKPNTMTENDVHYPSTSVYNLSDLYWDLMQFSAKHLYLGGRLVCWLPVYKDDFHDGMIPQHNCLQLIANSEQEISSIAARRLLTYEKVKEYEESENQMAFNDFRTKFFSHTMLTRQERRKKDAQYREMARLNAINRGLITK